MANPTNHALVRWKTWYAVLLIGRIVIGPWLSGYIHPDEFFQGGQELWFACSSSSSSSSSSPPPPAWEFDPQHALRSILPPMIMTWIPLRCYTWIVGKTMDMLTGREIWIVPRLACTLLSMIGVDASLWALLTWTQTSDSDNMVVASSSSSPWNGMVLLATAWPVWIFFSRPFTNTLETCCLAIVMRMVVMVVTRMNHHPSQQHSPPRDVVTSSSLSSSSSPQPTLSRWFVPDTILYLWTTHVVIGAMCAVGIFTRFTFVGFAIPIGLLYLGSVMRSAQRPLRLAIRTFLAVPAGSFLVTTALLVYGDYCFYSSRWSNTISLSLSSSSYDDISNNTNSHTNNNNIINTPMSNIRNFITPWNAFWYNANVANLETHGLHPRWTHAMVNMLILYGPLTLLVYVGMGRAMLRFLLQHGNGNYYYNYNYNTWKSNWPGGGGGGGTQTMQSICAWTVLVGLGFLSLAPHQEPRFLLPLTVPMVLLGANSGMQGRTWWLVWLVFNVLLLVFFGLLHQGGVIPSLLRLGHEESRLRRSGFQNRTIIYYHTYMPPTFLLRAIPDDDDVCGHDGPFATSSCPSKRMMMMSMCPIARIIDLQGANVSTLRTVVQERLLAFQLGGDSSSPREHFLQIVAPDLTFLAREDNLQTLVALSSNCSLFLGLETNNVSCKKSYSLRPHVTTEDLPVADSVHSFLLQLEVGVYDIAAL